MNETQRIPILLGMAEKGRKYGPSIDLLGITTLPIFKFFPQQTSNRILLLALPYDQIAGRSAGRIKLTSMRRPENHGWCDIRVPEAGVYSSANSQNMAGTFSEPQFYMHDKLEHDSPLQTFIMPENSTHVFLPVPCPPVLLLEPGKLNVEWEDESVSTSIGTLSVGFVEGKPISPEESQALLSSPEHRKEVGFELSCKKCQSELVAYERLDALSSSSGNPKATRLGSLGDRWVCSCGEADIDLVWFKKSVPNLFRLPQVPAASGEVEFSDYLGFVKLESLVAEFRKIIRNDHKEEDLQKFLNSNSVFWHFLGPAKILKKPPILNLKCADYGVLSSSNILYLIEIEKASTKLITRAGGKHHLVQKAFDQINDWKEIIVDHKIAVLDGMGLDRHEVSEIRYLVIAGTDSEEGAKIRRESLSDTTFMTFEELAAHVSSLRATMHTL